MVEKSGVERSGVEAWAWKVQGWNVLQLSNCGALEILNFYMSSHYLIVHWSPVLWLVQKMHKVKISIAPSLN
jgi:hypothetical protein